MSERAEFRLRGKRLASAPFHYTASGLDYVYLLNGFTIEDDPDYGQMVSIHAVDDLHRAIGMNIITKPAAMTSAEFRFLRKQMGLTQKDLAALLSVNEQTVANYEKNRPIPTQSENSMKFSFLLWTAPADVRVDTLRQIAKCFQAPPSVLQKMRLSDIILTPRKPCTAAAMHPSIVKEWHVGGMLSQLAKVDHDYAQ